MINTQVKNLKGKNSTSAKKCCQRNFFWFGWMLQKAKFGKNKKLCDKNFDEN